MSELLPVFLTSRVDYPLEGVSSQTVALGDWLLTPVRYLFDGKCVEFISVGGDEKIVIENEYSYSDEESKPQKNFLKTVAYIILFAPAIIFGTFIKALGYLSPLIRELHDRVTLFLEASQEKAEATPDQDKLREDDPKNSKALVPFKPSFNFPEHQRQKLVFLAKMMMMNSGLSITPAQAQFIKILLQNDAQPNIDRRFLKPTKMLQIEPSINQVAVKIPVKKAMVLSSLQRQQFQFHLQATNASSFTEAQRQFIQCMMLGFESPYADGTLFRSKQELVPPVATLPPTEVARLIQKGNALLTTIINGDYQKVENEERSSLELKIMAMVWALMSRATEKSQEFDEGTFLILDPHKHLYHFMMTLGAYPRISSHYTGRSFGGDSQWGFDLQGLPKAKRTLLFDLVDAGTPKQALFLKPENYGLFKPEHIFMHCYEWGWARVNKFIPGSDDLPNYRKERVPYVESTLFSKIIEKTEEAETRKLIKAQATLDGLSFMDQYLKELKKMDDELNSLVEQLRKELSKYDQLSFRSGREVIFTPADFPECTE